ncbi:MAG: hypothetical protein CMJ27_00065 [Phycisphaerae bacterium]|nr:hypothetical protein [Phycisphaerae bacterium]
MTDRDVPDDARGVVGLVAAVAGTGDREAGDRETLDRGRTVAETDDRLFAEVRRRAAEDHEAAPERSILGAVRREGRERVRGRRVVEEGGRNLSGGQRQRLEIARCLAKNPSILVLDGSTSALDGRTEQRLLDRIRLRGCTVVLVTSRRSTLRLVDEIAIVDQGRISDQGDFVSLVERNEWFATEFGGEA